MSSDLDSSLTSIDWLPKLGVSSLRSGKKRGGVEKDRKKDRGRDRGDFIPSVPSPSTSNSKGKPPHSYATLIAMAIAAAPEKRLSLNDIYTWISDTFPYYSRAGRGWKASLTVHIITSSGWSNYTLLECNVWNGISNCVISSLTSTELHPSQSVPE